MSSLMASSAPGHKMQEEPQFSRAVSSALQDMGKRTPSKQEAQQKEAGSASTLSSSPPYREGRSSPHEGKQGSTVLEGDEGSVDLIGRSSLLMSQPLLASLCLLQSICHKAMV